MRINKEWVPYLRKAYKSCPDFQTVATYPRLYSTGPDAKYHITYDNENDDSTRTIYKKDPDGSIRLCIPKNCRKVMQDNKIRELREYMSRT